MRVSILPFAVYLHASLLLLATDAYAQADFEGIWQPVDPINAHPRADEFEFTPAEGIQVVNMTDGTINMLKEMEEETE